MSTSLAPTHAHNAPGAGTPKAAEVYGMGHIRSLIFSYLDLEALQDVVILSRVGFPDAVRALYRRVEGVRALQCIAECVSVDGAKLMGKERAELYSKSIYRITLSQPDLSAPFLIQIFAIAHHHRITLKELDRILPDFRKLYTELNHLTIHQPGCSFEISIPPSSHQTPTHVHIDTLQHYHSECPNLSYRSLSSFTVSCDLRFHPFWMPKRSDTDADLPRFVAQALRDNPHNIRSLAFHEDVIAMSQLTDAFDLLPLSTGDQPLDLVLRNWRAPDFSDFGRFSSVHGHRLRSFKLDVGGARRRSAWLRLPDLLLMYSALRGSTPLLESLSFPLCVSADDERQCLERLVPESSSGSIMNLQIELHERPVIPLLNITRLLGTLLSPTGKIAVDWDYSPTLLVSSIMGKPAAQQRILSTVDLHAIGLTSYGDISQIHFDDNDVPSLPNLEIRPPSAYTVSGFMAPPTALCSRPVVPQQPRDFAIAAPPSSSQEETTDSAKAKLRDVQQYLGDKANRFAIAHHFRGIFKMFDQKAEALCASPSFT